MAKPKAKATKKPRVGKANAVAKKVTAKKPRTTKAKATAKTGTAGIKLLSATGKGTRRPPNNPEVPQATIDQLNTTLNELKTILDEFAQHLRSLDRRRLNGVGIHKLGFIERAYELTLENAEFLPHYLTVERFGLDIQYFMDFRSLVDLTDQIREKLWNITVQSADIAYTDGLEFYASVREAAKRRVDAAETLYAALAVFFKHHRAETTDTLGMAAPTEKKAKREFNSLLRGKHDGKLVIENINPKLSGGKRKIIDETFKDAASFKETDEGELKE
jgi:hypothetical protein